MAPPFCIPCYIIELQHDIMVIISFAEDEGLDQSAHMTTVIPYSLIQCLRKASQESPDQTA